MEIIFIIMLFCMGSVFGSFFTLAVYRIPLGLDITHERSFCPKCNHRLEFKDLIPVFSYLSLKGKCRYCKEPVRIRYLLLEVASGIVFVLAYFSLKFNFPFLEIKKIALLISFVMFYVTNCIILGIDKEYIQINKKVLLFGIITQSIYMLYLYIFQNVNLYRYGIYLVILLILFCLDVFLKKKSKNYYFLQILTLIVYEISFIDNLKICLVIAVLSIIFNLLYMLYLKNKKDKKLPIGFGIAISSILGFLIGNFI